MNYRITGIGIKFVTEIVFGIMWMQARRMIAKLELYRKFTNTLAISVIVSVAWIGYEVTLFCNSLTLVLSFHFKLLCGWWVMIYGKLNYCNKFF